MDLEQIAERIAMLTLIESQIVLHEWISEAGKISLRKHGLPLESVNDVYENLRTFYEDRDTSLCVLIGRMFGEITPIQSELMTSKVLFLLRSGFGFKSAVLMLNSFFDRPEELDAMYFYAIDEARALTEPEEQRASIKAGQNPVDCAKALQKLANIIPIRVMQYQIHHVD